MFIKSQLGDVIGIYSQANLEEFNNLIEKILLSHH